MKRIFIIVSLMAFFVQIARCIEININTEKLDTLLMAQKADEIDAYFSLTSVDVLVENVGGNGNIFVFKDETPKALSHNVSNHIICENVSDVLVVSKPVEDGKIVLEVSFKTPSNRNEIVRVSNPFKIDNGKYVIYYGKDDGIGLKKSYFTRKLFR